MGASPFLNFLGGFGINASPPNKVRNVSAPTNRQQCAKHSPLILHSGLPIPTDASANQKFLCERRRFMEQTAVWHLLLLAAGDSIVLAIACNFECDQERDPSRLSSARRLAVSAEYHLVHVDEATAEC